MADTSIQVSITVSLRKVCISVPKQYRTAERIHTVQDVYLQKDYVFVYFISKSSNSVHFDTLFDSIHLCLSSEYFHQKNCDPQRDKNSN